MTTKSKKIKEILLNNSKKSLNYSLIIKKMIEYGKIYNSPVLSLSKFLKTDYDHLVYSVLSPRNTDISTLKNFLKIKEKAKNFYELSKLTLEELEETINGMGLYRTKADRLYKLSQILKDREIPDNKNDLLQLPGIGEKVASVYISNYLKKDEIAVDIHVFRISNRLEIIKANNERNAKKQLMEKVPKKFWKDVNISFVAFGQSICKAKPKCNLCYFREICYYYRENTIKKE